MSDQAEARVAQKGPFAVEVEAGKAYFWCACGRSAKQPFCDGSHEVTDLRGKRRQGLLLRLQANRQQAALRRYA
jgi:CDGSH-type Zn-finger protein